jgi:hypothetical protein
MHSSTGVVNCTMLHLDNHFYVDGMLNIKGNELFFLYETGIFQSNGFLFMLTIRSDAKLTLQMLNEQDKGVTIRTTVKVEGVLYARSVDIKMTYAAVIILNGQKAVFDVTNASVRAVDNELTKPIIVAIQGIMCGQFGVIQLSIQNSNASGFILSPSCDDRDTFPSTLSIMGNFSGTLRTRIRNNNCDKLKMIYSNQNVGGYSAKVSVSSVIFDALFEKQGAVWQVFEGKSYISNEQQAYGDDVGSNALGITEVNLHLGQYTNTSGIYIYNKCVTNSTVGCSFCGAGSMLIGTKCIECQAGYFSDSGYPYSCKACPPGFFSRKSASMCTLCSAGTFSNASGAAECFKCALGTECKSYGCAACKVCDDGKFSDIEGSSQCKACLPGFIRNRTMDAGQCYPCPAGA